MGVLCIAVSVVDSCFAAVCVCCPNSYIDVQSVVYSVAMCFIRASSRRQLILVGGTNSSNVRDG